MESFSHLPEPGGVAMRVWFSLTFVVVVIVAVGPRCVVILEVDNVAGKEGPVLFYINLPGVRSVLQLVSHFSFDRTFH